MNSKSLHTEQQANVRQLPSCEQLLEICSTIPGLVYQFKQDAHGNRGFSYVSEGATMLLGVSPEELYRDTNFGLGFVHPEDVDQLSNSILQSANALTPWSKVFRIKTADGSFNKYVRANSLPRKQADGSIVWNGTMMDITETVATENHLLLIQRALEHTSEGIVLVDINAAGNPIIFANNAFCNLTGYAHSEIIGRNCRFLQGPDTNPQTVAAISSCIKNKQPFKGELLNYRKNGEAFWNYLSLNPIINADGGVTHYVGFQKDISERKQAEENIQNLNDYLEKKIAERTESLEQVNRELEAFSYTISHDLQAPLRIIAGFVKIIASEHGQQLNDDVTTYLQMIDQNVHRMNLLVKHVLAFAKLGQQPIKKKQVDMHAEVQALLSPEYLKALYPHTQVIVKPLGHALCDAGLIGQVWYNLIGNALKYSAKKEQPVVEIGTTLMDNELAYYVKDNGAGFSMAYAHKLFGVFQRLHAQDEFEGQGIGLATAQRIIARHGGRIWAAAEEGTGATFYFTLPSINPREN